MRPAQPVLETRRLVPELCPRCCREMLPLTIPWTPSLPARWVVCPVCDDGTLCRIYALMDAARER